MVRGNKRTKYSTFGIVVLSAVVLSFFLCFQQEACAVENPQQLRAETASVSSSTVGLKWHVASGKKIAAYDVYKVSGHKKKLKTVSSATKTYKAKKAEEGEDL